MYNSINYDFINSNNISNLQNKLLCTFTLEENISSLVEEVSSLYTILYKKIFVFFIKETNDYVITYNIDQGNINHIPMNTILVHRKKESNTLYTINAINELIKSLNGGKEDKCFPINWGEYKNCILLTQEGILKQLNTKIYNIINL